MNVSFLSEDSVVSRLGWEREKEEGKKGKLVWWRPQTTVFVPL